jgi:catechol 2,3-dioxygenase-like lactoylglutathione lyase family enzyme
MAELNMSGIAPFFIVRNVPAALSFYRDRLGFDITFQGPADDISFGIVQRGAAMIMVRDVGVDPLPNPQRESMARWDAYVNVPDPDALAAEFALRDVEFSEPLKDTEDGFSDGSLIWASARTARIVPADQCLGGPDRNDPWPARP